MFSMFSPTYFVIYGMIINALGTNAILSERMFTGRRGNGLRLRNFHIEEQIIMDDVSRCAIRCIQRITCRTMSWDMRTKTCLLGSIDVTHGIIAKDALEENADWNTMSLMEYTVFGLAYTTNDVTFEDAVNRCIEQSTVIAGPDDLLYSQSLGYGYLKCCWLADESIGYVIQGMEGIKTCDVQSNPQCVCILN